MTDDAKRRLAKAIDDKLFGMITGSLSTNTNTNATPPEPLTLDKLRRIMLTMPAKETWLSSFIFPADRAWIVKGPGENFTCAHPGFWLKLEDHVRKTADVKPTFSPIPLGMDLRPIEIDYEPDDDAERAEWKRQHWQRMPAAARVAMVPLPDWLRDAPEFSSFG